MMISRMTELLNVCAEGGCNLECEQEGRLTDALQCCRLASAAVA